MPSFLVRFRRPPDRVIGGKDDPFLRRWWIVRIPWLFSVYLHQFRRSDYDVMHDHPWANISIVLRGHFIEHVPYRTRTALDGHWIEYRAAPFAKARRKDPARPWWKSPWRWSSFIVFRRATAAHSIELCDGPVWTLFITGPRVRKWGFLCPQGWKSADEFLDTSKPEKPAIGCE